MKYTHPPFGAAADLFPRELDGAQVLYYTEKDDFGVVCDVDGNVTDQVRYLAICRYEKDKHFYLFLCDENYEVVIDHFLPSVKDCKSVAYNRKKDILWNKCKYKKI